MSEHKHTPGPWVARADGPANWVIRSVDYGDIVHRNCYPNPKVDTTTEADARLIAAAPDLLEACMAARYDTHTPEGITEANKLIKAAIEKALGKTIS